MQLKSLRLQNIRSYVSEKIDFPSGSFLLSGDIGSGKSTILLAMEFALFGILRGEITGNSLLRNGASKGDVELVLDVDGKEITIKRSLRRLKDHVEQDSGYIIRDGIKQDATAQELKSAVFGIIGYPSELVGKSKLIYRYTVYTPQEEMKSVILDRPEERLDVLRKVFDIDKYKLVSDNASVYLRFMRENIHAFEAVLFDYDEKKQQHVQSVAELLRAKSELDVLNPKIEEAKAAVLAQKLVLKKHEDDVQRARALKSQAELAEAEVASKNAQLERSRLELARAQAQLAGVQKEISATDEKAFVRASAVLQEKLAQGAIAEERARQLNNKLAEFSLVKRQVDELLLKVSSLDKCPTCLQEVSKSHKDALKVRESEHLARIESESQALIQETAKAERHLSLIRQEAEAARAFERDAAVYEVRKKHLLEYQRQLERLKSELEILHSQIIAAQERQKQAEAAWLSVKCSETAFVEAREQYDKLVAAERELAVRASAVRERQATAVRLLALLEKEIERREQAKAKMQQLKELHHWIESVFVPLVEIMERHVLSRVHSEFTGLFQKWFGLLVDDEMLNARLDDAFTPVMQQNGYDVDIVNLSGGEKTACALAYRLAMNQVINDIIANVRTKDILILDEPTDGFSEQQLDRMREVLQQLKVKQVILVSHEPKMESFVDSIIRIEKHGHVSKIMASG